jgi:hypothetical protein
MIGLKTIAAIVVTAALVAAAAARGVLGADHLVHLSQTACFVIGLVASLALGLVAAAWRPEVASASAVAIEDREPVLVATAKARELPGSVQRLLLLAGFACLALVALGNHAVARLVGLPKAWSEPSPSQYCMPKPPVEKAAPVAAPPEVEQPGCALVRRAYKLGYAKSLGACAPKTAAVALDEPVTHEPEVCRRRQLDEPYLHYAWRRVSGAASATTSVDPFSAASHRADEIGTHVGYLDDLLADIRHAITGTPHAAHHIWVNLPDPHPSRWREHFTGEPRCSTRFANLPLWPEHADASHLFEHVLGQLLFATRFGSTASCNDYTIHWSAPLDACTRLAADPAAFLAGDGAASIHAVLDRRRRAIAVRDLAGALGKQAAAPPAQAQTIASLACFIIDPAAPPHPVAAGRLVTVEGEQLSLREIRVPALRTAGDGPIDVYLSLAALLGGADTSIVEKAAPLAPEEVLPDDFPLTRLDPLLDADPFRGARWPLDHPELVSVYPFEHHLHAFIDTFRRRYLSQRGRL